MEYKTNYIGGNMKKNKFILILISILVVTLMLTACSTVEKDSDFDKDSGLDKDPVEDNNVEEIKETSKDYKIYNIETSKSNNYEAEIKEFDLGAKEYLSNANRIMPYNIKGLIGVPKGEGKFPLILITHGSHSNDDESKRFDTGFDYLVKDLAENGFIAISMDMSKPYIWKYGDNDDEEKSLPVANDHIVNLSLANKGEDPGFGIDLKDKIDFDKVALVGHSRGGETIFDIVNDQADKGVDIKSILSIAPTFIFDREWPDMDTAVLVPEFDGDIVSLDGFSSYEALKLNSKGFHSVTLLTKANHNYFNRNIERNDASMIKDEEELKEQLSREEQEEFTMNFAVDFFNKTLLGKEDVFLSSEKTQANMMYGFDVKTMYLLDQAVDLVDIKTTDNFKGKDVTIELKNDSWFYKHDEIIIDTITAGIGDITDLDDPYMIRPLINITWEITDSRVELTPNTSDFSKFSGLTFNMVIDSASELNLKESQHFTIELRDRSGNTSNLVLPEKLNALGYTPGETEYTELGDEKLYYWSNLSPLASLNLPLSEFEGVDLENIEYITLIFDKTDTGSIYIGSVYLQ